MEPGVDMKQVRVGTAAPGGGLSAPAPCLVISSLGEGTEDQFPAQPTRPDPAHERAKQDRGPPRSRSRAVCRGSSGRGRVGVRGHAAASGPGCAPPPRRTAATPCAHVSDVFPGLPAVLPILSAHAL
eukprot:225101-Chlamydomonas_euryale.AAC.9